MSRALLFIVAVLAAHFNVAGAATQCPVTTELAEHQFAGSIIAFNAIITAIEQDAAVKSAHGFLNGFTQRLTFQVLNSWKGQYEMNAVVHVAVRVTEVCGGKGCVFPFKVGDVALVLSPASPPYTAPMFAEGCWILQGVAGKGLLILPSIGD
jgi:hypothetical protein